MDLEFDLVTLEVDGERARGVAFGIDGDRMAFRARVEREFPRRGTSGECGLHTREQQHHDGGTERQRPHRTCPLDGLRSAVDPVHTRRSYGVCITGSTIAPAIELTVTGTWYVPIRGVLLSC